MPFKGNDFQYSRGEAYAEIAGGKYGEEHDEAVQEGVDLENGVRKYWADQLRKFAFDSDVITTEGGVYDSVMALMDLLDPYSGQDGADGQFARTTLDDRDEGCKWIIPNAES